MNILEMIDFYMAEYKMSEEDAEKFASIDFNICEEENPYEGL